MALCERIIIMADVSGSINIGQEPENNAPPAPPEGNAPPEQAIPLIGGDMDIEEIKANFNALLYLTTEVMAIQLKVLDLLVEKGVAEPQELNEKVLSVTGEADQLSSIYNEMFTRFVGYYSSLRKLMEDGKIFQADAVMAPPETGEQDV
jgi:hypothetical protein